MSSNGSLTKGEQEVVALVASQLTNRQIATRLGLSLRTVENRVLVALGKTNSANRHELAEWYWKGS